MEIERRDEGRKPAAEARDEASDMLRVDVDRVPVCVPDCPAAGLGSCTRACPDIPKVMSTDPERYPLEARIAPLAFELKRLGVYHPCWSCEGHNNNLGKLWKLPRVWFYCGSVVHVRLLADAMRKLFAERKLCARWRVALTVSTQDNPDTAFSLEPDVDGLEIGLPALQRDIDTIAEHLRDIVHAGARSLSRNVE